MELVLDILSWILIVVGGFFIIVGGVGLIRLPDVFCRMHAASLTETMGAGSLVAGLMIQAGWTLISVKLLLVLMFLLFTSPTSTYAIANSAWRSGFRPFTADEPDADTDGTVPMGGRDLNETADTRRP